MTQRWSFDWDHYLAGNRDFIVATMDVRGSGYNGNTFKHSVYKELGTIETQDTLHVLRYNFQTCIMYKFFGLFI